MKVHVLVDELQASVVFKKFKEEHTEAFFVAGFFILDCKEGSIKVQLDYYLPKVKRVAGFERPFKEVRVFDDEMKGMNKLSVNNLKVDVDSLERVCKKVMSDNDISLNPTKIIAVLRDNVWNVTCMNDALGIVRLYINAQTGDVKDVNKGSLMDFMGFKKV